MKGLQAYSQGSIIFLLLLDFCSGTFSWGGCPSVPATPQSGYFMYSQNEFDVTGYLGTWTNTLRNKDFKYSFGNCTQAYYSIRPDGNLAVLNSEIVDGKNSSALGEARIDSEVAGKLFVRFSKFAPWGNYLVAYTDYVNTSLVLSCFSAGIAHWKWAWILVRDNHGEVPSFFYDAIEEFGIHLSEMEDVIQTDCPTVY